MHYQYNTSGTCSRVIDFHIVDGKLHNVQFAGGCHGNLQGIGRLVEGQDARTVANTLCGVDCKGRGTSCPDQLARAIKEALASAKE